MSQTEQVVETGVPEIQDQTPSTAEAAQPVAAVGSDTAPVTKAPAKKTRSPRKPSTVDQTVARHQKALADSLKQAENINLDPPAAKVKAVKAKPVKADKPAKLEKPIKPRKVKLIRDSYAMPETEYAQIAVLKKRLGGLSHDVKKSELLRAGVALLAALNDEELMAVIGRVERIKTGRPSKK